MEQERAQAVGLFGKGARSAAGEGHSGGLSADAVALF
jgi:hypothetical protein